MTKESKTNIIAMIVVIVILTIGIIMRWNYISKELGDTFGRYSDIFKGKKTEMSQSKDSIP